MRKFLVALVALSLMMPSFPQIATAEGLASTGSTSNRAKIFKSQARLLDGRLSKQYKSSTKLRPGTQKASYGVATSTTIPRYRGSYKGVYLVDAKRAARKHGIPHDVAHHLTAHWCVWGVGVGHTVPHIVSVQHLLHLFRSRCRPQGQRLTQVLEGGVWPSSGVCSTQRKQIGGVVSNYSWDQV